MPCKFEPDALYGETEIFRDLGVTEADQARERDAGRLKGTLIGGRMFYRGAAVNAWIDGGGAPAASKSKPARSGRRTSSTVPAPRSSSPSQPSSSAALAGEHQRTSTVTKPAGGSMSGTNTTKYRNPAAEVERRIEAKMAEGVARHEAHRQVMLDDPDLRDAYTSVHNANAKANSTRR